MKKHNCLAAALLVLGVGSTAQAQSHEAPRVLTCDTTIAPQSLLTVQDEASSQGALVENPALVTMHNGMKAVQFSVRHARNLEPFPTILKVRYTVHWTDDCGRSLKVGSDAVNGIVLDPQRQEIAQSNALRRDATHATLRIYVVD